MEELNDIQWTNLKETLEIIGNKFIQHYREKLDENDVNASHTLEQSLKQLLQVGDNKYELYIQLEDYWKYIEYGRKAGKFPPIDKIRRWVEIKPVLPYPNSEGNLPTPAQLAFLISRSIAENGIQPRPLFEQTLDEINIEKEIEDAVQRDVETYFKEKWNKFLQQLFD